MSLWTSLEPASATVDPGGTTRVRLRLRNTGDVVDEYRFEPVGPVAPWTTVEPASLRLYPGTTGTVELHFAPPRTPDAAAGPHAYAVRITPTEHPEAVTVPEGNLTVTPFTEVRAELVPPTVKGRFRGRPRLAVDNLGNTRVTASVAGSDNGDHLTYDVRPGSVQIEPGRAAFVRTTLKPRRIIWFGPRQERPYTLAVQRSGTAALPVEGTYVQRGFLPRWLAGLLGAAAALAVAFVMIWLTYRPTVNSGATEKLAASGPLGAPTSPAPVLSPAPQPSAPAPQPAASSGGDGGSGEGRGNGGGHRGPKPVVPATGVLLRDTTTRKCADVPGYDKGTLNGPVQEYTCDETTRDNQRWNLEVKYPKLGPGGRPLFQIRNVKDGLCMDLPDYGAQPVRTPITEFTCDGTTADNQLWWMDRQQSGAYWIRNYASDNKCLDVAGYSTGGDGTDLTLFDCSASDDQEWTVVHPSEGG
ncbi:RICIN domain-containing protein [Streptomyces tropicalis]|uniref:Ricin-type beta-trefoil lectin domain protein n=1 Tax=Streptomyces tropicalis TaxID=3034234 RepID=A0ABT6A3I4_9ACTN|nr:RICIN domain-containing protein [Streptomyces tropicalis]MDF3299204.1 ricin-type beta-trefoil lectin domain protein [Streptomyces tropicalis]